MPLTKDIYECHITIDPVMEPGEFPSFENEGRLDRVKNIAKLYNFKVANLFMLKTGQANDKDTFMTGHSYNYEALEERMLQLIGILKFNQFKIRRYKIEKTLLDSRVDDEHQLLV